MKKVLPQYANLKLVSTVYGDDLADKSYREAQGLLKSQPNVKVIVAPTDVPGVGRFAVLQDPQGAVFSIIDYLDE